MPAEWLAVTVAIIGSLGNVWGYLSARKASKDAKESHQRVKDLERVEVEALAFERARKQYDAIIDELKEHVSWLKRELADRTEENSQLRQRIAALEEALEALKRQPVVVLKQD